MAILAMLVGATFVLVVSLGAGASAAPPCDKVASPVGLDSWPGSETQPVRTAQKLADLLLPGETGCLKAGVYGGGLTLTNGGTQGNPVTLESYPGGRARISGPVSVEPSADFVTISGLDLAGSNPDSAGSLLIQANHVRLEGNDITNNQIADCVFVGTWDHLVTDTVIEDNRIHNCGELPATNRDHGISIWNASATQITDNVIYDNANRGIQLFPNAQQTSVVHNTIDANGEGILISGTGGHTSDDNKIERNVISNSTIRYNVETYWPDGHAIGGGNVLRNNCVFGGANAEGNGGIPPNFEGLVASGNLVADPAYVDRPGKNLTLQPGPCRSLVTSDESTSMPTEDLPGWHLVFNDDFSGTSLDGTKWGAYHGQPGGDPGGWWEPSHCTVGGGVLNLENYRDPSFGDKWVSCGVSSSYALKQLYGRYEVRMRMDAGHGIQGVLLLWPSSPASWPPEFDFWEAGGIDSPDLRNSAAATLHYTPGNQTIQRGVRADFTTWHRIGVEWTPGQLVYTLDGRPWATVNHPSVPTIPMEMDMQTQAGTCGDQWAPCPDSSTPKHVNMQVDWVAAWAYQP
jgi:beta-glucanase (GH16 family)